MPPLKSLVLLALFLYPALFVAVIIHEAGHALLARLIGHRVTSFGLGAGRPFFRAALPGGAIFFLCRDMPTLGTCWTTTAELLPSRLQRFLLLVGGGVTNLVAGALGFALLHYSHKVIWLALAVMNLLIGLSNLAPFRQRVAKSRATVASDGLQAISLFLSRHARAELPQAELGFRSLWEEIGDTRTLRYRLFRAALAAQEIEAVEEASRYANEAESLPADDTDAHLAYLRGRIALQNGDTEAAAACLRQARSGYDSLHASGSILLCDLYRSLTKDLPESAVDTDKITRHPLARRADVLTKLAAIRLLLFTRDGDTQGGDTQGDVATMETLLARYESARRSYRADTEDVTVYKAVAQWREKSGDAAGARFAAQQAAKVQDEITSALSTDPALSDWYRQHIGGTTTRPAQTSPRT